MIGIILMCVLLMSLLLGLAFFLGTFISARESDLSRELEDQEQAEYLKDWYEKHTQRKARKKRR